MQYFFRTFMGAVLIVCCCVVHADTLGREGKGLLMPKPQIELIVELPEDDATKWGLSRASIAEHIKARVSARGIQIADADAKNGNGMLLLVSVNLLHSAHSVGVSFMRDVGYNCGDKEVPRTCWLMGSVWNRGSLGVSSTNNGGQVLATMDDDLDEFLHDLIVANKSAASD